jgi:DNA/RNA-binding domain of Phe-tRNA-synthetase-like protein
MLGAVALGGVENPKQDAALEGRARDLEADLRSRFLEPDRSQIAGLPCVRAYADYYKRFGKTYHLILQLESVTHKNKAISGSGALVQAMFMAEMKNLLLTAGHDLGAIQGSLTVEVAEGSEEYATLAGTPATLKAGDMCIRDDKGVISSIVYGPDHRTRITADTRAVLYAVYAVPGIPLGDLERHLGDLEANVRIFSPNAVVISREVLLAQSPLNAIRPQAGMAAG